jgi:hypothetical protein
MVTIPKKVGTKTTTAKDTNSLLTLLHHRMKCNCQSSLAHSTRAIRPGILSLTKDIERVLDLDIIVFNISGMSLPFARFT